MHTCMKQNELLAICVCVLSARVDRGSDVESNQQASRLQTYDNQGTLCVRPYLNLIVLQQTMTEKMVTRKYDPVVRKHVEYKEGKIK